MRPILAVFFTAVLLTPCLCAAQAPAPATPAPSAPPSTATAALQPALASVHSTLDALKLDKWKRGSIRDEATKNVSQIIRDIDVNLPPLLRDADSAPGALSTTLPLARNLNALYDVLLRVSEASRVSGPDDQADQLQKALVTLGNARLALADRMQGSAEALEKQVVDLRTAVQAANNRPAPPPPSPLPCIPPPLVHHTTKKPSAAKPAAKPPTTTTPPTTPAKPAPAKPPATNNN